MLTLQEGCVDYIFNLSKELRTAEVPGELWAIIIIITKPGVVVHACHPSTGEAEEAGLL